MSHVREHVVVVGNDCHIRRGLSARVAAAENGGPFALFEQQAGDAVDGRSLARAADTQITDADHGLGKTACARGVPSPPPGGCGAVDGAERIHDHCTSRKGRTTPPGAGSSSDMTAIVLSLAPRLAPTRARAAAPRLARRTGSVTRFRSTSSSSRSLWT